MSYYEITSPSNKCGHLASVYYARRSNGNASIIWQGNGIVIASCKHCKAKENFFVDETAIHPEVDRFCYQHAHEQSELA